MVNSYHNLTSHPPSLHHRGIFHDETVYPDSHAFNPGRFLTEDGKIDPSVPDPEQRVFGSGRRLVSTVSTKSPCFLTGITTGFARVDSSQSKLCLSPLRRFLPSSTFHLRWMRTGGLGFPRRSSRKTLSGTQKRRIPLAITTKVSYSTPFYLNSHPVPFDCIVKPRSDKSAVLIAEALGRSS